MSTIGEQLHHYALGEKGHTHTKRNKAKKRFLKENKNVTKVQDFLGDHWGSLQKITRSKGELI